MVFAFTQENDYSLSFHFKANRKALCYFKNDTRDFWNSPLYKRSACFNVAITGDVERFQYLNFEASVLKS